MRTKLTNPPNPRPCSISRTSNENSKKELIAKRAHCSIQLNSSINSILKFKKKRSTLTPPFSIDQPSILSTISIRDLHLGSKNQPSNDSRHQSHNTQPN